VNIQIKKDDLLRVTLKEIPSTGYVWRFQNPFENKLGIYSVQMDDFTEQAQGANGENPVGAAGKRTIVLRGDQIGQEEFELILVRSWEFKDFVEVANSNGQILKMKDIPNAVQYRRVIITVKE
jgi:predicted secreted protein